MTLDAVWNKGTVVAGYDPAKYRKDNCGAWMDICRLSEARTARYAGVEPQEAVAVVVSSFEGVGKKKDGTGGIPA